MAGMDALRVPSLLCQPANALSQTVTRGVGDTNVKTTLTAMGMAPEGLVSNKSNQLSKVVVNSGGQIR